MKDSAPLSRRRLLGLTAGLSAAAFACRVLAAPATDSSTTSGTAYESAPRLLQRVIPSSGENLPVIGLGTYGAFDKPSQAPGHALLTEVLENLLQQGGTLIDSSPMYGRAEQTVGELLSALDSPKAPFLATKVWTHGREQGIEQMERSFALLKTDRIDLMQVHNLVDWRTHLPVLRDWKAQGRIRYIGISHYSPYAYEEIADVLQREPLDFLQINYALGDRGVEDRILPICQERGVAVICNRPFGGGSLLRQLKRQPLPTWAAGIGADSWAQLALRFVIAHPTINCVIPGTGNPRYMAENLKAGIAEPLTEAQRRELIRLIG